MCRCVCLLEVHAREVEVNNVFAPSYIRFDVCLFIGQAHRDMLIFCTLVFSASDSANSEISKPRTTTMQHNWHNTAAETNNPFSVLSMRGRMKNTSTMQLPAIMAFVKVYDSRPPTITILNKYPYPILPARWMPPFLCTRPCRCRIRDEF